MVALRSRRGCSHRIGRRTICRERAILNGAAIGDIQEHAAKMTPAGKTLVIAGIVVVIIDRG